jgi:hypothetical protein
VGSVANETVIAGQICNSPQPADRRVPAQIPKDFAANVNKSWGIRFAPTLADVGTRTPEDYPWRGWSRKQDRPTP